MKVGIYSRKSVEKLLREGFPSNTAVISFYDPLSPSQRDTLAPVDYSGQANRVFQIAIHDRRTRMQPTKGVFWVIGGQLLAFPYMENCRSSGLAKSGDTYAHKRLWPEVRPRGCGKPYNYYPRGRIEINSRGKAILYMNPNVDESLIPEIMAKFGLREPPEIICDNSSHYKCYLDDGWKADK